MHRLYILDNVLLCLLVAVMFAALWFYRKCIAPYSGLPGAPILTICKRFMFTKIPKNMTPASFYFQELTNLCKTFHSDGISFMRLYTPYLFIFGEEAVKLIINEEAALDKASAAYDVMRDGIGRGLVTSNGDMWKKQRKMLNPLFHTSVLKDKVPILNKQADFLVKQLLEVPHEKVDIHKYLKFCSFSIICETIMGLDVKEKKAEVEEFLLIVTEVSDQIVEMILHPWMHPKYNLYLLPGGKKYLKQLKKVRKIGGKILTEMIESTRSQQNMKELGKDQEMDCGNRRTFARALLQLHLKDPSTFTLEYMVDELLTFIVAGYDTVSYTLMWCLFLLGHHQDIQEQVYNELESVSASDLVAEDLSKLTYMECVIKETLRLYPAVPLFGRELQKTVQMGKYTIPKGTTVFVFNYLYHRNPEIYPDPEQFDPERFSQGRADKRPWTFTAFSEGKRSCIGKKLALMEMKIVLFHILRQFRVTSLDRLEDIKLNCNIVLNTVQPLHVRLTPRQTGIHVKQ